MSQPLPNESRPIREQLTAIESLLMHLQHDLEQLHEALAGQQNDIAALRRTLAGLHGRLEQVETGPEERDPTAEKPPHY